MKTSTDTAAAALVPTSLKIYLPRRKARVDGRTLSRDWGTFQFVSFGTSQGANAKTERCTWSLAWSNPHWNTLFVNDVEGETTGERDERIKAKAAAMGATYKHGIVSVCGKAKSTDDAIAQARAVAALGGFDLVIWTFAAQCEALGHAADAPKQEREDSLAAFHANQHAISTRYACAR